MSPCPARQKGPHIPSGHLLDQAASLSLKDAQDKLDYPTMQQRLLDFVPKLISGNQRSDRPVACSTARSWPRYHRPRSLHHHQCHQATRTVYLRDPDNPHLLRHHQQLSEACVLEKLARVHSYFGDTGQGKSASKNTIQSWLMMV